MTAPGPGVAWQKLVRERRAAVDADADLFGRWWERLDRDLARSVVRPVELHTARSIIAQYEWLGTMPACVLHCYGIVFDGAVGGVVVYGPEYTENLGVWDRYGFTGKIVCLARGACVHWSPRGAASRLIRGSMRLLPRRYEVVTATTDVEAGEVGTIYQACNFHFAPMETHARYHVAGRPSRTLRAEGLRTKAAIAAAGLTPKLEHAKGRYFAFRGSPRTKRRHLRAIAHLVRPYPRRDLPLERVG
jgi:hypothetical protein